MCGCSKVGCAGGRAVVVEQCSVRMRLMEPLLLGVVSNCVRFWVMAEKREERWVLWAGGKMGRLGETECKM